MRSQLRKLTFPKMWKALEKFFARHQGQHCIAQEFQLLVVADGIFAVAGLLRFLFPRLRAVRHRLLNNGAPPEMVAQSFLQRRDFPFLHTKGIAVKNRRTTYFFGGVAVCPGAEPPLSFVKRSFSSRAALPTPKSGRSFVRSTAWSAYFIASGSLFCMSRATANRKTATGSGCCGRASIDFRKFSSASGQLLALKDSVPRIT